MRPQQEELKQLLLGAELDLLDRLEERCLDLEARVGDDKVLAGSVRDVIVDVLRDAGVRDYDSLARVLAPIVIASIRDEIRNSRDMMVDALYPITGRLVAAAVRNAFQDLIDTINEKLDRSLSADRWRARIKAKLTGRSEAEILLQQNPPFEIAELLVIHRLTGLLIARVTDNAEPESDVDRDLVSGMLTAIMSFSRDAFGGAQQNDLHAIDFGGAKLLLRTSPTVILAVRVGGTAPRGFERALDGLFTSFIERWGATLSQFDGQLADEDNASLEPDLRARLAWLLKAREDDFRPKSRKAVVAFAAVALLVVVWVGYGIYDGWRVSTIERTARTIVAQQAGLEGYPLTVRFDRDATMLVIEGLVPAGFSEQRLRSELSQGLPNVPSTLRLGAPSRQVEAKARQLETRLADVTKQIDALKTAGESRDVRLRKELTGLRQKLTGLETTSGQIGTTIGTAVSSLRTRLDAVAQSSLAVDQQRIKSIDTVRTRINELEASVGALDGDMQTMISTARTRLNGLNQMVEKQVTSTVALEADTKKSLNGLEDSIGGLDVRVRELASTYQQTTPRKLAELDRRTRELSALAQGIADSAANVSAALRTRVDDVSRRVAQITRAPSVAERLRDWAGSNAIFFVQHNDFRNTGAADKKLRDLASLVAEAPKGVRMRVIGYSDPSGSLIANQRVSERRAQYVVDKLKEFGVPDGRLVAVGRAYEKLVTSAVGNNSLNRRVEFEVLSTNRMLFRDGDK